MALGIAAIGDFQRGGLIGEPLQSHRMLRFHGRYLRRHFRQLILADALLFLGFLQKRLAPAGEPIEVRIAVREPGRRDLPVAGGLCFHEAS